MNNENIPLTLRRSSRVPAAIPIFVTSLNGTHFSEMCETLVVNAHGCAMRSSAKLDAGVPLHFHNKVGRETTARVVSCYPIGPDNQNWLLGAKLDQPENFWGLPNYPKDWVLPLTSTSPRIPSPPIQGTHDLPVLTSHAWELSGERAAPQLSERDVRRLIVEAIRSLHTEITSIKEKLARAEANRSRFEVSLSSIPPELEEQLELRLRQVLAPRVVDEARQQSARLLSATEAAIEKRAIEVREEFQARSAEEFRVVEQRAGEISANIVATVREQLRDGVEGLQRKLADGRSQLQQTSGELLVSLQNTLKDEHNARWNELERLRGAVVAESSRLQEEIGELDGRIFRLNESVRGLESGLDKRLSQMAGDTVKNVRNEIEGIADTMLKEVSARAVQTLETQMDEASGNMRILQNGILTSVSDSLKAQTADALQKFEHSMDELAQLSVERWRHRLATGLNAMVKNLEEQF
jgi:hypothetical protein